MKVEDFNNLSEEEKQQYLDTIEGASKQIDDLTAERDSFKKENEQLIADNANSSKELKATKELNFALARKVSVAENKDDEQLLYNFMKEIKQR